MSLQGGQVNVKEAVTLHTYRQESRSQEMPNLHLLPMPLQILRHQPPMTLIWLMLGAQETRAIHLGWRERFWRVRFSIRRMKLFS